MVRPPQTTPSARARSGPAVLLLNGEPVGTVHTKGWDTSWGFGEFSPNEAFANFAPVYGMWSLLMHANDDEDRLSRDARQELARAETLLDAIKVQLLFGPDQEKIDVAQLTIDGNQLEWKEY